jgi:flagellum-specific ATP synthase
VTAATLLRPRGLDDALRAARPQRVGTVTSAVGLGLTIAGLDAHVGEVLTVGADGTPQTAVEVVATDATGVRCMPLGRLTGITAGTPARSTGRPVLVPTGAGLFGRVLDGLGRPIDDRGPLDTDDWVPLDHDTPNAMARTRIDTPMQLGVRVLDTLTTVGRGQRMGLFAGSGVGKSSLLSMIARGSDAAVNVIALVGERGREVREFLEDDLGPSCRRPTNPR